LSEPNFDQWTGSGPCLGRYRCDFWCAGVFAWVSGRTDRMTVVVRRLYPCHTPGALLPPVSPAALCSHHPSTYGLRLKGGARTPPSLVIVPVCDSQRSRIRSFGWRLPTLRLWFATDAGSRRRLSIRRTDCSAWSGWRGTGRCMLARCCLGRLRQCRTRSFCIPTPRK